MQCTLTASSYAFFDTHTEFLGIFVVVLFALFAIIENALNGKFSKFLQKTKTHFPNIYKKNLCLILLKLKQKAPVMQIQERIVLYTKHKQTFKQ
jgi:hypothetical protein